MKDTVRIHIGEYFATDRPTVIETILGSCVAVCLYDPKSRVGGMNHIFLPGKADMASFNTPARYGINAMELLINKIMVRGGNRRHFVAKVFGGANVISNLGGENGTGRKNAEFAIDFLKNEKIPVISMDLGGHVGRKIMFHTDTNDVYVKRMVNGYFAKIRKNEDSQRQRIENESEKNTEITMFDLKSFQNLFQPPRKTPL